MIDLIIFIIYFLLVILFFIIFSVLFIPFEYDVKVCASKICSYKIEVLWLFRVLKLIFKGKLEQTFTVKSVVSILTMKFNIPLKKERHKVGKSEKKHFTKNMFSKKLLKLLYQYVGDIIKLLKPKYFSINGTYGFDDPSVTGILCGVISIVDEIIPNKSLNIQPDFLENKFDIRLQVHGRVFGIIIIYKTIRLLMKKEVRNIIFNKEGGSRLKSKAI